MNEGGWALVVNATVLQVFSIKPAAAKCRTKLSNIFCAWTCQKTFDRIDWGALWLASSEHGVSAHMLWILLTLYLGQHGEVTRQKGNSRTFQMAMSKWRTWAEGCSFGFDPGDGLPPLLDLKFADDILIFARSFREKITLLDKLVQVLGTQA